MLVSELIQQIAPDTKDVVQQAVRRHGQAVRDALRDDLLRFKLEWSPGRGLPAHSNSCSIEVDEIGVPEEVAGLSIAPQFELAALLALWLTELHDLRRAATGVGEMIGALRGRLADVIDVYGASVAVRTSAEVATRLSGLAAIADFDLVRTILAVNKDVLGRYHYDGVEGLARSERCCTAEIKLYWGVIGLFARSLGVSTEALTVVVLAHDSPTPTPTSASTATARAGRAPTSASSEHELKESLAQYYAALVAQRLDARVHGLQAAYEGLLRKQPPAYQMHQPWLDRASPEAVASVLALMRRRGSVGYDVFDHEVRAAISRRA